MGGRVRSRLNNILIHLHNYTAGRYRGGGILYCCRGGGGGGCMGVFCEKCPPIHFYLRTKIF